MRSLLSLSFIVASLLAGASGAKQEFPNSWVQFEAEHGNSMDKLFEQYKSAFSKKFTSTEDESSHKILFVGRVKEIFDWNAGNKHSYTKGINRFTDMTEEERKRFVMPETKVPVNHTYYLIK